MRNRILTFGLVAGLIAGGMLSFTTLMWHDTTPPAWGMALGYTTMLIAFSTIFVAIKRQRDEQGGVIRFWPAFGTGIGITIVASIIYVLAWEAALAITHADFIGVYTEQMIAEKRASGASAAEIASFAKEMAQMRTDYQDPLYRMPLTFAEIFPVGLLVSLIAAGLLRNPRFLPLRPAAN